MFQEDFQSLSGANKKQQRNLKPYVASIIVTSDTCYENASKDESGSYILEQLNHKRDLFSRVTKSCVKDDKQAIVDCLKKILEDEDPALIITIGGTGLCPRDVTPDALCPLYDKHCNGIVAALNWTCMRYSPNGALSRLSSGTIGDCLIVNFPGSLKAVKDCLACLDMFIVHALEQVRFNAKAYNDTHLRFQAKQSIECVAKPAAKVSSVSKDLSPIVVPKHSGGDKFDPLKQTADLKRKYSTQKSVSPAMSLISVRSAGQRLLNQGVSRLSIKDVQDSRTEQQQISDSLASNQPLSASKRSSSYKKRFTSLENISLSQNQKQHLHPHQKQHHPHQKQHLHPHQKQHQHPDQKQHLHPQQQQFKQFASLPKHPVAAGSIVPSPLLPTTRVPETKSTYPLIDFVKAYEILGFYSPDLLWDHEEVTLNNFDAAFKLIGRVLFEDLKSLNQIPPYLASTVDGYVLNLPPKYRKTHFEPPKLARLVKDLNEFRACQIHAQESQTFFCYRINTGGRLPPKNFAVVPIENTASVTEGGPITILGAKEDEFQRKPGSDMNKSDTLPRGTVIGSLEMGLIISMGHRKVSVFKQPRIGVLSTGDEIVNFFSGQQITEDSVADLNGPLLTSVFRAHGYYSYNCGIVEDEPNKIYAAMAESLKKCDILIVTGGASMGTKDYVKDVIKHMDGTIHFGRVNMKPGKPVAFASIFLEGRRKFIFSLPGNPVSAYMTAFVLVLPFIEHGNRKHFELIREAISLDYVGESIKVEVAEIEDDSQTYEFDGRLEFVRAKIIGKGTESHEYKVKLSKQQQSSRMLSLKDCDCFLIINPSLKGEKLTAGAKYSALRIKRPL